MSDVSVPVRVFVGADRSRLLAVKVLEYSIQRHTDLPVEVHPMVDLPLPEPRDPRQGKRTGFSFARFAIPELAGYQGRALYLNPDMQVFKDIRSLWNLPFDGAKVIIQDHIPDEAQRKDGKAGAPYEASRRRKQAIREYEEAAKKLAAQGTSAKSPQGVLGKILTAIRPVRAIMLARSKRSA